MFQLIYVSQASAPMSNEALLEILVKARINNSKLGVTGLLLHRNNSFAQALEGPKETVISLYEKISKDPRHHSVNVIIQGDVKQPDFPDWEMGFSNTDAIDFNVIEGFSNFMADGFTQDLFQNSESAARVLLAKFKLMGLAQGK